MEEKNHTSLKNGDGDNSSSTASSSKESSSTGSSTTGTDCVGVTTEIIKSTKCKKCSLGNDQPTAFINLKLYFSKYHNSLLTNVL